MTSIPITKARSILPKIFSDVFLKHKRVIVERYGHERVAIVPISDLEAMERWHKKIAQAADASFNKTDKRIPWDKVKKELGL